MSLGCQTRAPLDGGLEQQKGVVSPFGGLKAKIKVSSAGPRSLRGLWGRMPASVLAAGVTGSPRRSSACDAVSARVFPRALSVCLPVFFLQGHGSSD